MTSKIVVNNIESDTGIATVTINSNINVNGSVSSSSGGISIGTGVSISSPSSNTLKVNAGIANSDAVTIGEGNFLYAVPSNAVYDNNTGPNVGDYWSGQFASPSRGNSGTKVMVGTANTIGFVGFAHTNTVGKSIISSYLSANLVSNTAGSETGEIRIMTKSSAFNALERFKVSPDGYITKPYQPTSCVYNMSASLNTGSESTWQLVKFQTSTVNRGSAYSSSTGLYTCPVAGVYFVSAFFLTRANAAHNITIYKNGTGIGPTGRDIAPSGQEQNTGIMAYVDCAANDNLAIYVSNGSGGDFYVAYNYALFSLFG